MIHELDIYNQQERNKINDFLKRNINSDYMQSIEWNIIRNENKKYFLYYVENDEIIWSCNLLEKKKNSNKYLYAPRGPVLKDNNFELINIFLSQIKDKDRNKDWYIGHAEAKNSIFK